MAIWRMSFRCGNRGFNMWSACRDLRVAAITYRPLAHINLADWDEGEPRDKWAQLSPTQYASLHRVAYEMAQGDTIYVKSGPTIVASGKVNGPYQFQSKNRPVCPGERDVPWSHQVPIDWDTIFEPPIKILLGSEPTTVLPLAGERLRRLEIEVAKHTKSVEEAVNLDLTALYAEEALFEKGGKKQRFSNHYERNPKLRVATILCHGAKCMGCGFDFGKVYGEHGAGYIEVHHLKPVSDLKEETKVDPKTEMAVVCSNCHRMIHRKRDKVLSLEELRLLMEKK